jgi:hypothetical protein
MYTGRPGKRSKAEAMVPTLENPGRNFEGHKTHTTHTQGTANPAEPPQILLENPLLNTEATQFLGFNF